MSDIAEEPTDIIEEETKDDLEEAETKENAKEGEENEDKPIEELSEDAEALKTELNKIVVHPPTVDL